jgi:transposase
MKRATTVLFVVLMLALLSGCSLALDSTLASVGTDSQIQPDAGQWDTWVLASGDELRPTAPPDATAAEIAELKALAAQRDAAAQELNAEGLAGLADRPRPGREPVHSPEVRSALIDLALQKPRSLGYPFELWTLERLQRAFKEREGTHLSDSTIWSWMDEEGLKWKRQQSWFHEPKRHDPEFVEKRGVLSKHT